MVAILVKDRPPKYSPKLIKSPCEIWFDWPIDSEGYLIKVNVQQMEIDHFSSIWSFAQDELTTMA